MTQKQAAMQYYKYYMDKIEALEKRADSLENRANAIFLTEKELGSRWKIDSKTIRNWRCQKRGPSYIKLGFNIRYSLSEIERYEKSDEVKL